MNDTRSSPRLSKIFSTSHSLTLVHNLPGSKLPFSLSFFSCRLLLLVAFVVLIAVHLPILSVSFNGHLAYSPSCFTCYVRFIGVKVYILVYFPSTRSPTKLQKFRPPGGWYHIWSWIEKARLDVLQLWPVMLVVTCKTITSR